MKSIIDINELDVIYLSYDEPKCEEFWPLISANVPWAKRVHGIKGSDAAHKAAAATSDTERFILIDGDNIPNWDFFNQQLILTDENRDCVFRWRAVNAINGLTYGNGGLSCWTREFVNNMKTHEATDGSDETVVEFCFDKRYWAMHDVWSTTYPNQSEYHAWRAGFREGVKLCLDQGRRVSPDEFSTAIWQGNRTNLEIWCNVGVDAEFGINAIMGAVYGAYKVMFELDWDYTEVRDFDLLENIYKTQFNYYNIGEYRDMLSNRLEIDRVSMSEEQSAFFKKHMKHTNIDVMLPERDYIGTLREVARSLRR